MEDVKPSGEHKSADLPKIEEPLPQEVLDQANQGIEDSQLKAGQHYLTLADTSEGEKREEHGKLAILWLSKASKQGNEKATKALKKCLETKTGITDENREDVKWCVNTSAIEKKIRYAARNMFHSINATHKDVLSADEYAESIKKLTGGKEQKLLLAAGKKIGDSISENEFVKILSRKVQGTMTLTSTERSDAYDAASPVEKVVKFPRETAMIVADQALEFASNDGLGLVMSCVPTDQIYFLTLFFMYSFLSTKFLLMVVPLVVFYISFAVIIITTLQMFYKKRKLQEANALAEMLKQYDTGVSVDDTQSQYSWNSLTPYLVYFAAIPMVVVSFSLADKTYIPCSELCVLSGVLCGICFIAISDSHDFVTFVALLCSFLASLPIFFNNFPDVPVLSSMIGLFSGSFVSFDLYGGLKLNIGIPSVCYCIIPIFFVQMAARKSFQGMYRVLVPHLVCFFWFNLIVAIYPFTTWIGLTRATVGYVMLPLLIPLSALLFIIGMIYLFVRLAASDLFGKLVITLLLAGIPILLTQTKKLFGGKLDKNKKFGFLKKIMMVVFAVLAIIPLIFVRLPSTSEKVIAEMSLSQYMTMCEPQSADTAGLQIKCGQLKGTKVKWSGEFVSAAVSGSSNEVTSMLDVFPSFVANPLRCIYGKPYGECDDEGMSDSDREFCQLMVSLGHECHLREHDKYTFNFVVKMESLTISVDAGNGFRPTVLALEQGDQVDIKGSLVDGMGTSSLKLKLKEVTCTNRELDVMQMVEEDFEDIYYNLFDQSLKVSVNFFWHPLMEYVPQLSGPALAEAPAE